MWHQKCVIAKMGGLETNVQKVRFTVDTIIAKSFFFDDDADFDECATGVCTNCTNSVGSFQCTCPDGMTLSPGQTCVGEWWLFPYLA